MDNEPWAIVRLEAAVTLPPGTRIGLAADGEGTRLILPDGCEVEPVLGFEVLDNGHVRSLVSDQDMQPFGINVTDYRRPTGGVTVENGQGVLREDE